MSTGFSTSAKKALAHAEAASKLALEEKDFSLERVEKVTNRVVFRTRNDWVLVERP
jgi:hypothetical protein